MQSEHIERAIKELRDREREFEQAVKDLPVKKHAWKLKYAMAIKRAEGTVAEKEATAMELCQNEYLDYLTADARVEAAKQLLYDCRMVMNARRSLMANERSEREFAASGIQT